MAIRTFVFCDCCNPHGIRAVADRRSQARAVNSGRRWEDGRAWVEGALEHAIERHNWKITADGYHVCDNCQDRLATRGSDYLQQMSA